MPRCDGAEFAARYRLRPHHAPVILLTASDRRTEHCREIDADACLGKPFDIDELLDAVAQRCLALSHAGASAA
jgi:CheY-like chemotaxis protein